MHNLIPLLTEARETQQAQHQIFSTLPKEARKTTTVDNGLEFADHKEFDIPVTSPIHIHRGRGVPTNTITA